MSGQESRNGESVIFRDPDMNRAFLREGYVVTAAAGPDQIAALRALFARHAGHHTGAFSATILDGDTEYRAAVHSAIAGLLEETLQALLNEYRPICCGFAVKQPEGERGAMPLHQDITMLSSGYRPGLSLWLPLVDVDARNGCLQIVPRSHRLGRAPRAPGTPFRFAQFEGLIREHLLIDVPLRAGEAIVIDHGLFHASGPNRGNAPRLVATATMAPVESPFIYYHRNRTGNDAELELFMVEDDFYLHHTLGKRPDGLRRAGSIAESDIEVDTAPLREELLAFNHTTDTIHDE